MTTLRWMLVTCLAALAGASIVWTWPRPLVERPREIAYGSAAAQRLDLYPAPDRPSRLLFLWLHGGGWAAGSRGDGGGAKPRHFIANGHRWAAVGTRLLPEAPVEAQLDDIARAVGWVRTHARALGIRRDGIVLVGHSSGAHLAAMLGTDPRWLARRGVPLAALRGVVMIDSASLDLNALMANAPPGSLPHHERAFGSNPIRRRALSPQAHAGGRDASDWLLVHDAATPVAGAQAARFASTLNARSVVVGIANSDHGRLASELGYPADPVAVAIDDWLRATTAPAT